MSNTVKSKCDQCGKEVSTYFTEKGWIHFDLNSNEDEPNGFFINIVTNYNILLNEQYKEATHILHEIASDLDFCSIQCLGNWLLKGSSRRKKVS